MTNQYIVLSICPFVHVTNTCKPKFSQNVLCFMKHLNSMWYNIWRRGWKIQFLFTSVTWNYWILRGLNSCQKLECVLISSGNRHIVLYRYPNAYVVSKVLIYFAGDVSKQGLQGRLTLEVEIYFKGSIEWLLNIHENSI